MRKLGLTISGAKALARGLVLAATVPAGLAALAAPVPAMAQAADPARETVDGLDTGLIAIMKAGGGAGQAGRVRMIAPVVERAFDLPLMTRLSVGPAWTGLTPKDQQALTNGFRAMTVAQYAHNFDSFAGERFAVVPKVDERGGDRFVRTTLNSPGHEPEALNYRLRESGGQWKIIDVYYRDAVSQLTTRRSEFAAVLARGGASALIAHLNAVAANPK